MRTKVDYIIVGLGLAGIAYCEQLLEHGKSFVVFENNAQTSSLIAGGVYNPVVLKRFTPAWNGHEQLQYALPRYKQLERKLNVPLDTPLTTKKILTTIHDQNNWFTALDKPNLSKYMNPTIEKEKINGITSKFGFGVLQGTGRIDTHALIAGYKNYLKRKNYLIEKTFNYEHLKLGKNLFYKTIKASKIVFCEGFGLIKNPFFNYLPLRGTKGEMVTIYAPNLRINFLLKSSVFVMPLGNEYYKVGATFNWTDKTSIPTKAGRQELQKKLNTTLSVPYTITHQTAGIRPTVKDRRPLVGKHPKHSNLAVLNGLGTRGVIIAPTAARHLFTHLELGKTLDNEIDIARFNSLF